MLKSNKNYYKNLLEINKRRDDWKIHYWMNKIRKDSVSEYVIIYDDMKLINIYKGGKILKSYFIVGFNRSKKNFLDKYDKYKMFVVDKNSRKNVKLLKDRLINPKRNHFNFEYLQIKPKRR